MVITILTFIVILGILVFVHEFGHFIVAKKSGMKVDEFGFGFPPRICGIQKINGKIVFVWGHRPPNDTSKTVYSINWIFLGGFVKIVGENNESPDEPRSFVNKPFFSRLSTLVAGVLMNIILAWALLSAGYISGLPVALDDSAQLPVGAHLRDVQVAVIDVVANSPAATAGLAPNDIITSVDGQSFSDSSGLRNYILQNAGHNFDFGVKRGKQVLNLTVASQANPAPGSGPTGIALAQVGRLSFPWYKALGEGAKATLSEAAQIVTGLYSLFASGKGFSSLGGPVKIATLTGEVASLGFIYLVQFTAFLSLNLAILNILPIPALDGGRVMFLIIEKIRGKSNNQKMEQLANTLGFSLLLLLMLAVTIHDVIRIFHH